MCRFSLRSAINLRALSTTSAGGKAMHSTIQRADLRVIILLTLEDVEAPTERNMILGAYVK